MIKKIQELIMKYLKKNKPRIIGIDLSSSYDLLIRRCKCGNQFASKCENPNCICSECFLKGDDLK